VFVDPESGIDYYIWGVGSDGGQDDVIQFTTTSSDCGMSSEAVPYNLLIVSLHYTFMKILYYLLYQQMKMF
jgi:hypothetical protein